MNIVKATHKFEAWLGEHTHILKPDLRLKHQAMAENVFSFLRATFYRWIQIWPEQCRELAKAPRVHAVGDLHVENFGTWRDREGRLIWGVNDFDEATDLPYTVDLVRLTVSAILAIEAGHLTISGRDASTAIRDGYRQCLLEGGRPYVLEEDHAWLREIATGELRDPVRFWRKMESLPVVHAEVPKTIPSMLEQAMPEKGLAYRLYRRIAGLGSLGRPRLVAIANYHGAKIAREAKARIPSAVAWASGQSKKMAASEVVIGNAVRCPDPFLALTPSWIVRRLSPHCSRIELSVLPKGHDELRLLFAMGWETANIHLGSGSASRKVPTHFDKQKSDWLFSGAKQMLASVNHDWRAWRKDFED